MITKSRTLRTALKLLLFAPWYCQLPNVLAQGTAFTYQGLLNDGSNPANGNYGLRFVVYDNRAGGSQQGPVLTNNATVISNGLFLVTLDFGNQFPGAGRWLEIGVRTNGGTSFVALSPRQALTPAPYAITAGTYGNALTLNNAANQINGSFTGNGANVTNVNAAKLGGVTLAGFWQTGGNLGNSPGVNILARVNEILNLHSVQCRVDVENNWYF